MRSLWRRLGGVASVKVLFKASHPVEERLRSAIQAIANRPLTEKEIDCAVHSLFVTGGDKTRRDYPQSQQPATAAKTADELIRAAEAAEELHGLLVSLHAPAASTFGQLDLYLTLASQVSWTARAGAEKFGDIANAEAGREPELLGKVIDHLSPKESLAHCAASIFLQMTGKWPTIVTKQVTINNSVTGSKATGEFMTFLEEVFAARGITKGIESSAKAAIRAMEFHRAK